MGGWESFDCGLADGEQTGYEDYWTISAGTKRHLGCRTCRFNQAITSKTLNDLGTQNVCRCKPGYYGDEDTVYGNCYQCPAGMYTDTVGKLSCDWCVAGKYSSGGWSSCGTCESGKYSFILSSECFSCPAGKSSNNERTDCVFCGVGKYSSKGGNCENCEAGKSSNSGSDSCFNCGTGKFASTAGSECADCAAGKYKISQTACQDCAAGKYSAAAVDACSNCGVNQYSGVGSNACENCPLNSQAPSVSTTLTSCKCNAGFAGPNGGTCGICSAGKYTSNVGSSECISCLRGYYSGTQGATVCSACVMPSGALSSTFLLATGATACRFCASGMYADQNLADRSEIPGAHLSRHNACRVLSF